MNKGRVSPGKTEIIDRTKTISFTFDGKTIQAYNGDTVASALYANGQRIFSRSFKYHRPRGLLCVSGRCPNCMVNIDGNPNSRACTVTAREGMVVKHQNAWPSLQNDFETIIDKSGSMTSVGFYYKSFIHPSWAWPVARRVIKRITGIGVVNPNVKGSEGYDHEHKHVDVIVIGGGPAGMSAAMEAASFGVDVLLVDDQPDLGGHLRFSQNVVSLSSGEYSGQRAYEVAKTSSDRVRSYPNIEILNESVSLGVYEGNLLAIARANKLFKVRAAEIIICSGSHERRLIFANNDLPGVFLVSALQRLVSNYSVKPDDDALIVTNSDYGYQVTSDLVDAGVGVTTIVDTRSSSDSAEAKNLRERGITILESYIIVKAEGINSVKAAVVAKIDGNGNVIANTERRIECKTIGLSMGFEAENSLLYQSGCKFKFDEALSEYIPEENPPAGVCSAGEVTGLHDLEISILQGKISALKAISDLSHVDNIFPAGDRGSVLLEQKIERFSKELDDAILRYRALGRMKLWITSGSTGGKRIACVCEDVTDKDLLEAIGEGFDEIELLKRYSTFSMGPCQGKMCGLICTAFFANATGKSLGDVARTTSRAPCQPVPLGLIAGQPKIIYKLTPIHQKHLDLNARVMDHGDWRRPRDYGSVETEYWAVRKGAGLIDVSTLGRFEISGRNAAKFLDFIFGGIYSNMKLGKAKYAPIFTDTGIVVDDGIVARLGDDRFFVTCGTGGTEFFEEYTKYWAETFKDYLATDKDCLHITNLTAGLAAVNIAGPKAREVLSKMTNADLSSQNLPYMSCMNAKIAGVNSILLRIGFVGEAGWEIHFPAEYGEYMWDEIMKSGKDSGIRPVGVEAMKVLRLEKRIIWPDIDTDRSSDGLESGLGWSIKLEKPDFVGKHYLSKTQSEGLKQKVIGFVAMKDNQEITDGDLITDRGGIVGRVTSARYSFAMKKYIGLGWAPVDLTKDRTTIELSHSGKVVEAQLVQGAFYDPEGKRLKE